VPRVRFAIALLVPEPAATEIDGLRRALGDRGIENVVPHITLIPPVNIREEEVPDVLAGIRDAAAATEPMVLTLGPPATFEPVSPVVYLEVGGDVERVRDLRDALHAGPLARPLVHDFVPHVTINEDCGPERIDDSLRAIAGYQIDVRVDRLHLLRDRAPGPRRWNAVADAAFEPPLVVGTGGLPMAISVSELADVEVASMFAEESTPPPKAARPVVVVARREQEVVAAARGFVDESGAQLIEVVGDRELERQLLRAATRSGDGPP
jgi:2'-5' RNA ligase